MVRLGGQLIDSKIVQCADKIILMMHPPPTPLSQSSPPSASSTSPLPQKQEWAIINKYKALEFERMKQRQYSIDKQKKEQFRLALDQQLNSRNNAEQHQKQQNRLYYQQLSEQALILKLKEEALRDHKYNLRLRQDCQNTHNLSQGRHRIDNKDTGYHLEIGEQSQKQHRAKSDHFRRQMMDTLDIQLRQKQEESAIERIRNQQIEEEHKRKQGESFKPSTRRLPGQNQRIFDYYQQLDQQKQAKDRELEVRMVDEARYRREVIEMKKEQDEEARQILSKELVKETLDQQVKQLHRKRLQEGQTNPQDVSFDFISGIFQNKYKGYSKHQYKRELDEQAQQQRQKKIKQSRMSDQQYRLNMNQLSKAVIGDYAEKSYIDRSLGAIGNHEKYQLDDHLSVGGEEDGDVGIIKGRLMSLRNGNNLSAMV